jgi:NADH-ubiquinone oxidoreductase chain 3
MNLNITLLVFILCVPVLALIFLGLNALLSPHRSDENKLSSYECGVPVISGQTRESFPVHFHIVAMLFLVFDIELVLLLPISVSLRAVHTYGFIIAIIFFIILTIGFIVELATGAITIVPHNDNKDNHTSLIPVSLKQVKTNISILQSKENNPPFLFRVIKGSITKLMNFDSMYCYSIFTNMFKIIVYIIIPGAIALLVLYCALCLLKYTGVFNEEELTNILDKMSKTHMP